ncbi:MAG: phage tail tape measure protein [Muribaculaceae bacterium]|nr:phage tail tape measure protein [Muribaculaceae bacterium]
MAYSSTANIVLSVNGKQARQMMDQLEKDASRLRVAISKAIAEGDKASLKKYRNELVSTNKMMDQLKGQAKKTEEVLSHLDKATPKELNSALKQLKRELNGIERGTEAWDAHVAKIRAVKSEIDKVNASMREEQGQLQRMGNGVGDFIKGGVGKILALTGVSLSVNEAVDAYASMEEEMVGVEKFTGLARKQVEDLNEEFKKIDTRTSREDLNKLAQQAGALGKDSSEEILGFVKAADQINVALDELGEDAVLNISKLNGVFGYEEQYGTEQSLLKVGSVINELSASCAASAPYLAEFTSRVGGVGSQAGISISDLMAFGAVLDAQGKNVEKSSTALQQLIVHMMQDPAKYAQAAGLEVQQFTEMLQNDANGALLQFLDALNSVGGMDALAPLFADMGEKGSGMVETLSTLAANIDMIRAQQQVANEAFAQGTSVTEEFNKVNNDTAAQLDKAKKNIHEAVVSLGQQLAPTLVKVTEGVATVLQYIPTIVNFLLKNKVAVLTLVGAYTACNLILAAHAVKVKVATAAVYAKSAAVKAASVATSAYKVSVAALNVVVSLFTGGVRGAKTAMQALNTTIKANPIGLLVSALTTVIALLAAFKDESNEVDEEAKARAEEEKRQADERKKQYEDWKKGLTDVGSKSAEFCKEEMARLDLLYKKATDETASREERRQAALRMIQLYPEYFGHLSAEQIMVGDAAEAYKNLRDSIIEVAKARAYAERLVEVEKELVDLEMEEEDLQTEIAKEEKQYNAGNSFMKHTVDSKGNVAVGALSLEEGKQRRALGDRINAKKKRQDEIKKEKADLTEARDYLAEKVEGNALDNPGTSVNRSIPTPRATGVTTPAPTVNTDKFAEDKAWYEQQKALNDIEYYSEARSKEEYEKRILALEVEYAKRRMDKCEENTAERTKEEAAYYKAVFKQAEASHKDTIEAEAATYKTRLANIKQQYLNGELSKEEYDKKIQEAEKDHLKKMTEITAEGTKERADAEEKYRDYQIKMMEKQHAKIQKIQKNIKAAIDKFNEQILNSQKEMKDKYFGPNAVEKQQNYNRDLRRLKDVYEAELKVAGDNADEKLRIEKAYQDALLALHEEHFGKEDPTGFKGMMEKVSSWLEGDGGKALKGSLDTAVSGMSNIFSQLTAGIKADLEIQTKEIENRYDAEISKAEGNAYKVAQLEKQKEAEIAAIKQEASEKEYQMQVIQAIAQTAQNALAAYGSAAAIPLVGHILAPIAAAAAVAAGMLQVQALKKQQQAAAATGYAEGGFTRKGGKYEPAGIVHAGEWVAPQEMVNSPQTRPLINALEYARRTNTYGSIRMEDVSRTITAPAVLAASSAADPMVVNNTSLSPEYSEMNKMLSALSSSMTKLNKRLNEPFVTMNTVAGDKGINNALNIDGVHDNQRAASLIVKNKIEDRDKAVEIYLTEEELQALYEMPLTGKKDHIRDVFLIGCYTCQRISDYNNLNADCFETTRRGNRVIRLVQQKTKTDVTIPVLNDNLIAICEKYSYNIPKANEQVLNRYIKGILKELSETLSSLKEKVATNLTMKQKEALKKAGKEPEYDLNGNVIVPRYECVTSHTARRTGITNMYLSHRYDTFQMMSVSGHKTQKTFMDYIKLSSEEIADEIVALAKKGNEMW